MKCLVTEKSDLQFACDKYLIEMITSNQIKPGDKFHFQGLYMVNKSVDDTKQIDTEHFYLQNKHKYYLKINLNGMSKALSSETLGE
jgi:hypothetical protein